MITINYKATVVTFWESLNCQTGMQNILYLLTFSNLVPLTTHMKITEITGNGNPVIHSSCACVTTDPLTVIVISSITKGPGHEQNIPVSYTHLTLPTKA